TGAGDGFVADAAVFAELGCRAACVATSLIVPDPLPLDMVARQIERASESGPVAAARVGFVHGVPQVELIAAFLRRAAPEMSVLAIALHSGDKSLQDKPTRAAIVEALFPAARVVVVRAIDASELTGVPLDDASALRETAESLRAQGARAAIVSGFAVRGR